MPASCKGMRGWVRGWHAMTNLLIDPAAARGPRHTISITTTIAANTASAATSTANATTVSSISITQEGVVEHLARLAHLE